MRKGCSKFISIERERQKKYNAVEIEITVQKFTVIQKYCKSFFLMYVCIMYKSFLLKPTTSHLLVSYVRQDPHQLPKPKNYPSVSYDLAIQKSA